MGFTWLNTKEREKEFVHLKKCEEKMDTQLLNLKTLKYLSVSFKGEKQIKQTQ